MRSSSRRLIQSKMRLSSLFSLILLLLSTFFSLGTSARIRGKFDRFGKKDKHEVGPFVNEKSKTYYHDPNRAKIVSTSRFETEYELGRKIIFFCTAEGNPMPRVTWMKNGIELYEHSSLHVHEWLESDTRIKSKMEIDPATTRDRGEYECLADNKFAFDRRRFRTDYFEFD